MTRKTMAEKMLDNLGPLSALPVCRREIKARTRLPSDDRGTEHTAYCERLMFEPFVPVNNHEQQFYGLRYATMPGDWARMRRFTKTPGTCRRSS
jgi:hypothetical protein